MTIQVVFFASLREKLGQANAQLDSAESALHVWQQTTGQKTLPNNVLIARNHEYVTADSAVKSGDEIAFFPPVTGG